MKLDRRRLIKAGAAAGVAIPAAGLLAACSSGGDSAEGGSAELSADSPLYGSNAENMQGKTIDFAYSRVAGWPPSAAPTTQWPDFQAYAKEKYGYTVNDITFIEGIRRTFPKDFSNTCIRITRLQFDDR